MQSMNALFVFVEQIFHWVKGDGSLAAASNEAKNIGMASSSEGHSSATREREKERDDNNILHLKKYLYLYDESLFVHYSTVTMQYIFFFFGKLVEWMGSYL